MITKTDMLNMLMNEQTPLSDMLSIEFVSDLAVPVNRDLFDATVIISWAERQINFMAEIKTRSTPKTFQYAITLLQSTELPAGYLPLLIMPYLTEKQLSTLAKLKISGFDLSGNCAINAPGEFAFFRSGQRNAFPSSALIKNIYKKNSSMVTRVFFSKSEYSRVGDILNEINKRNLLVSSGLKKPMSLSTVSKTLKTLEQDLIVSRDGSISLLQPDKALSKLADYYTPPSISRSVKLKVKDLKSTMAVLLEISNLRMPITATGLSSSPQLVVTDRGELLSVYCTNLQLALDYIGGDFSSNFPNLELIETQDERVYFNASKCNSFIWASPIQVYLELIVGDKRDKEVAEQVRNVILTLLEL
ncbi:MAG: hypothetical protein KAR40_13535 [Candidatus Sabulitectum sp.]|nr:hypothetical protein [Candidatus Sabulitectum sp.]